MSFETCILPGAVIVRPKVFPDNRGYFKEVSRRDTYAANGIDRDFVQINMSHSRHGVLRGLHYQLKFPQAKLVSVAYGAIYDVIIDCRKSSAACRKLSEWPANNSPSSCNRGAKRDRTRCCVGLSK